MLGLDVGDRRVGVAVSDAFGLTAQPVLTVWRTVPRRDAKSIGRIVRKQAVAEIVVGNPLHMSGDSSPQAAKAQAFAEMLREELGLPVRMWDERLTTAEAHELLDEMGHPRGAERRRVIDQVAAVLILQSFLNDRELREARAARPGMDGHGEAVEQGVPLEIDGDRS